VGLMTRSRPALGGGPASPAVRALADAAPLIVGYLPFGLLLGATVAASNVPSVAGWASSGLMFAGAAQLATIDLLDAGAGGTVVVATALVINLRHVMYSAALAPYFSESAWGWRLVAPHVLVDPVYTLAAARFPVLPHERARRRYYATLGATVFLAWLAMTGAGVLVGARLPALPGLGLAVPLVFVALLIPSITDRPTFAAAVVGGGVAIAAHGLPMHLGLIVGAVAGVVAGLAAETGD
jgi:predicted branched-subunit amino acid permease